MTDRATDSTENTATGKPYPRNDVPPQSHAAVASADVQKAGIEVQVYDSDDIGQAQARRDTLQAEASINLAIGYAISYCGYSFVDINDEALAEFSRKRMVTVEKIDGGYRYTVSTRK